MSERTVEITPRNIAPRLVTRAALVEARAGLALGDRVSCNKPEALFYHVEVDDRGLSAGKKCRLWCSREEVNKAWEEINKPLVKHLQRVRSRYDSGFQGVVVTSIKCIASLSREGSGARFIVIPERDMVSLRYETEEKLLETWEVVD